MNEFHSIAHTLGDREVPLSADNDSHANETTAKQESSLSLFGPIFLAFQQSLICWQKCLGPLTAKVTESTTHPADGKHGI